MAEFKDFIKKDPDVQNEISQKISNYNKESFSTRSQIGQKRKFFNKQQTLSVKQYRILM